MNKKMIVTVSLATLLLAGGTTGAIYSANQPAQQNQVGQMQGEQMQAPNGMMNQQMQAPNGMMNQQMPMNDRMGQQGFGEEHHGNFDQGQGFGGRAFGMQGQQGQFDGQHEGRGGHGKMNRGGHGKMDRGGHGSFENGGIGGASLGEIDGKDRHGFGGFWAGILALLLIQALAIGGYFGYKHLKNRKNNSTPTPPDQGNTTQVTEEPVQSESTTDLSVQENNDQNESNQKS